MGRRVPDLSFVFFLFALNFSSKTWSVLSLMTTADGTMTSWLVMHWMDDSFTTNLPLLVMRERLQGIPAISAVNTSDTASAPGAENTARQKAAQTVQNLIILLI